VWSSIQRRESLAIELKFDNHHSTRLLSVILLSFFAVILGVDDFSIFEEGGVEIGGFFGLAVEPETRGYLRRHCVEDGLVD
jgi:hypothetical protein